MGGLYVDPGLLVRRALRTTTLSRWETQAERGAASLHISPAFVETRWRRLCMQGEDGPSMTKQRQPHPPMQQIIGEICGLQILTGQTPQSFSVQVGRTLDYLRGQRRSGGAFVPVEAVQVVPHELLVETPLGPTRLVVLTGPEP
jgi:hypothetical protein